VTKVTIGREDRFGTIYRIWFNRVPPRQSVKFVDICEATKPEDSNIPELSRKILDKLDSLKHIRVDNMNEAVGLMSEVLKSKKS